ncbi:helix-turn-helix domain-containing protein [Halobellus captivus]|uniref:hypothetical protein n=1 Tax=Halobellus captivus TaxID=2592614 RepID=UPI00119E4C33|nr:hypothetical protein [Halobellus captivus]
MSPDWWGESLSRVTTLFKPPGCVDYMLKMQLPGRQIEQQYWADLLLFLYSKESKWENFGRGDPPVIDSDHPLVERTNLNKSQVKSALSFLEGHDLIEEDSSGYFKLTSKGFDVAYEREIKEKELQNNSSIILLTVVLAIGALGQTLAGLQALNLSPQCLLLPGLLLLIIGYVLGKYDRS